MTRNLPDAIHSLQTRSPEELWGVSAESLYFAVCAVSTDTDLSHALKSCRLAAVLQTNDERAPETVTDAHRFLLSELGLVTEGGELTDCGRFVLATDPATLSDSSPHVGYRESGDSSANSTLSTPTASREANSKRSFTTQKTRSSPPRSSLRSRSSISTRKAPASTAN